MLTFAVAVFFLIITPGPGVLSVAGVGSAFGSRPGIRYIAGLLVGTNLVALAVVSGLAAIALADANIRHVLLIASAAYLTFLAARIAFSGTKIAFIEAVKAPGFWGGITLQAVNPKAYAVNTALFTGFAFWPENLVTETMLKFLILNGIWIPIHFLWLFAGVTLHRLNLPAHIQSRINIAMALSMLAVVGLAAFAPK
ncbi:MAG: LysE family transporter [Rhodospirillales bacterium]|jgi:threonine/homoserine/homoserine lactone efflux protein|nr:LysE family transporter [Rhodospirillales bacterium]